MPETEYAKGLEGVIAAQSEICRIDGEKGELCYRGYSIYDLAEKTSFEEVTYLLLYGRLPAARQLADFSVKMRKSRAISPVVLQMIRGFPEAGSPMELLQSVVSYLSSTVKHRIRHSLHCNCRDTLHQVAQMATVLAAYQRYHDGKDYVEPRQDLSHGANFLYMLHGREPEEYEGRIFDACLVLHAEHGFNASTFTSRVVASTRATCYCSIAAAIGALSGALHGGANERVLEMLDAIGGEENIAPWLDRALAEKRKVMGMGHRVYKTKDPRAVIMEGMLEELAGRKGDRTLFGTLKALENSFHQRMQAAGKPIYPNVDFFSGAVYTLLGIPRALYTPIFAMSRVSGWLAHILEQRQDNRLYRPKCLYAGPGATPFVPMEKRAEPPA